MDIITQYGVVFIGMAMVFGLYMTWGIGANDVANAMGTSVERSRGSVDLYKQGYPYDMAGVLINGMDVFTVYKAMKDIADEAREGKPFMVDMRTYRYRGHSMSDPQKYRTKEEMEAKKDEDPIVRLKAYMLEHKLADSDALDTIDAEVKQVVLDSVEFAENSPYPNSPA